VSTAKEYSHPVLLKKESFVHHPITTLRFKSCKDMQGVVVGMSQTVKEKSIGKPKATYAAMFLYSTHSCLSALKSYARSLEESVHS
jgi:hypothetical protein